MMAGFLLLLILDRLSKQLALIYLIEVQNYPIFFNIISLSYKQNYGISLGLLSGNEYLIFYILIFLIFFILINIKTWNRYCTLTLIGALSNLLDRILYGFAVDMIKINMPLKVLHSFDGIVVNLADIFITIGLLALFLQYWTSQKSK